MLRGGKDIWKDTDLSVLVSRDIRPFKFSLATTSAASDRFEHDGSLVVRGADKVIFTCSDARAPGKFRMITVEKAEEALARLSAGSSPRPVLLPSVPHFLSAWLCFFFPTRTKIPWLKGQSQIRRQRMSFAISSSRKCVAIPRGLAWCVPPSWFFGFSHLLATSFDCVRSWTLRLSQKRCLESDLKTKSRPSIA